MVGLTLFCFLFKFTRISRSSSSSSRRQVRLFEICFYFLQMSLVLVFRVFLFLLFIFFILFFFCSVFFVFNIYIHTERKNVYILYKSKKLFVCLFSFKAEVHLFLRMCCKATGGGGWGKAFSRKFVNK